MKLNELLHTLLQLAENIDGNPEVIMASDAEGNDFSPFSEASISTTHYIDPDKPWVVEEIWVEGEPEDDDEPIAPTVVLWPL